MKKVLAFILRFVVVACVFVLLGSVGAFERDMISGSQLFTQICAAVIVGMLSFGVSELLDERRMEK